MTVHPHRSSTRLLSRARPTHQDRATPAVGPRDPAPEVLLALAALLVVLAGPVAQAFAPDNAWVAMVSAGVLVMGILLALGAARRLLRLSA